MTKNHGIAPFAAFLMQWNVPSCVTETSSSVFLTKRMLWSDRACFSKSGKPVSLSRAKRSIQKAIVADITFDTFLPALGVKPEAAVFASAVLATSSVALNFFSGVQLENKRAELAIEVRIDPSPDTILPKKRTLQPRVHPYQHPTCSSACSWRGTRISSNS
jgi:hypothetical protein